jgi:predicted transcriptional regulator
LERIPEDPRQELVISLAGPAVNVVLAAALYVALALGQGLLPASQVVRVGGGFLDQMFWINVTLALFNLVPAFPMDGGRVLRALLAMRFDYVKATQIAASVGQAMAVVFVFLGLQFNPFLLFIAFFVWVGAAQEAGMVQMRSALSGIPVSRAMIRNFETLSPGDTLARAIEHVLAGFQQDFPVVDEGRIVGVLTRTTLASALAKSGPQTVVGDVMERKFITTDPGEMLQTAFSRLKDCECHTLPVVRQGRLLGLMTSDNLAEVLMIQEALRSNRNARGGSHSSADGLGLTSPRETPLESAP